MTVPLTTGPVLGEKVTILWRVAIYPSDIVALSNNGEAAHMEPMVVCSLEIVAYCSYLTVKDVVSDLTRKVLSSGSPESES